MGKNQPPETLQPCIKQLTTAAQRIQDALDEASPSVEQLGSSFTSIVSHSRRLSELTHSQSKDNNLLAMQEHCGHIENDASRAIMGFQFYDRLSQRLGHVNASLLAIAELLENTEPHPGKDDWEQLVVKIVETLCLDDDKANVATLLDHKIDTSKNVGKRDDSEIELF